MNPLQAAVRLCLCVCLQIPVPDLCGMYGVQWQVRAHVCSLALQSC